jgi:hypothetical protein
VTAKKTIPNGRAYCARDHFPMRNDFRAVINELDLQYVAAAAALDVKIRIVRRTLQRRFDCVQRLFRQRQEFRFSHATLRSSFSVYRDSNREVRSSSFDRYLPANCTGSTGCTGRMWTERSALHAGKTRAPVHAGTATRASRE